ncbi:CHAP domain containing protein [Thermomonospora curvata DSM 43183]|uniref:CHAP domain containing protein n=1 Tax=Thermomonospora curvata (strain ATCC 19995 / DSM 43183 / JCM 3096 / KCTC 9072 / NBRC 15933 / NCIMB 10081 / Henssen B9) TaxID=471852 RepID=D1A8X6_THECD|nr:CHAP domain containing protein [Thermomonospora curvata DSM 43183]
MLVAGKHHITRLTRTLQSRKSTVASALVAGAVATTALGVAAQAPAQAAVGAAAPITTLAESGKAAKSLAGGTGTVSSAHAAVYKAPAKKHGGKKAVTAGEVIEVAESQLGLTEDAKGESKFGKWYASTPHAKRTLQRDGGGSDPKVYKSAPWCAMFVTWVGEQVGTDELGADAYTVTHAKSFKDKGRWGTKPKPGAVVFFDWAGGKSIGGIDHVGLVAEVLDNGKIKTVEGNISNAVVSKVRTPDTIVGYGYPDYAAE